MPIKTACAQFVSTALFLVIVLPPFHTIAGTGSPLAASGGPGSAAELRTITEFKMDSSVALGRANPESLAARSTTVGRRRRGVDSEAQRLGGRFHLSKSRVGLAQIDATAGSISTGSGDINEVEPNDQVAQNVFMPANIEGVIAPSLDQDFFAFPCFAGEQINIEAFASRIPGSLLVADIGLFDSAGNLITESVGDGVQDPLIQFVATADGILFAGITDVDGFGGANFVYLLSIAGGVDVDEVEPNNTTPQALPASATTVFGQLTSSSDTDLYSFSGAQGETVIIDVDAALFGSPLVSAVTLTDSTTGTQYFSSDHNDGNDPRFNIVLPATGAYVIGVVPIDGSPGGFYRMNVSLVPGANSPLVTAVTRLKAKVISVTGVGLNLSSIVEVNGKQVDTTVVDKGQLNARSKAKPGAVVTVANLPDLRRSNPLILQ
jgi:hypothetical protein